MKINYNYSILQQDIKSTLFKLCKKLKTINQISTSYDKVKPRENIGSKVTKYDSKVKY